MKGSHTMNTISLLTKQVSSLKFDRRLATLSSFSAAILILALGVLKLTSMELTEAQLVLGLLMCVQASLLLVLIGFVAPMYSKMMEERSQPESR